MRDRKLNRLEGFDYSVEGYYFVSICTKNKIEWLGKIKNNEMLLNRYGKIVLECLRDLPNHYSNIRLDAFIIMPNHLHCIIIIKNNDVVGNAPRPFLLVGNGFKPFRTDSGTVTNCSLQMRTHIVGNGFKPFHKKNQHSLSEIIRGLKTFSSYKINKKIKEFSKPDKNILNSKRNGLKPLSTFQWQKSFFDHIIRNEQSLNNIREYIINNPLKWELDIENRVQSQVLTTKEYYANIIVGKK